VPGLGIVHALGTDDEGLVLAVQCVVDHVEFGVDHRVSFVQAGPCLKVELRLRGKVLPDPDEGDERSCACHPSPSCRQ
jgi:hypothetical protein